MNTIYLDRLIENAGICFDDGFYWDGFCVTESDVIKYIQEGGQGASEPYGDTWKHPAYPKDKEYHVSRVAWFVIHPNEIKGIEIDNEVTCDGRYILPKAILVDGWHRIMAAKISNVQKIKAIYGGRIDVLRYLQKRRKTNPERLA